MVNNQLQGLSELIVNFFRFLGNTVLKILFVDRKHDMLPKFMIQPRFEWVWVCCHGQKWSESFKHETAGCFNRAF